MEKQVKSALLYDAKNGRSIFSFLVDGDGAALSAEERAEVAIEALYVLEDAVKYGWPKEKAYKELAKDLDEQMYVD